MSHTILLIQPTGIESRTWADFETLNDCLENICKIFEEHLKSNNPRMRAITYDIAQLFEFIDHLADLGCLVMDTKDTATYVARNKDWIKGKIYDLLKSQATK